MRVKNKLSPDHEIIRGSELGSIQLLNEVYQNLLDHYFVNVVKIPSNQDLLLEFMQDHEKLPQFIKEYVSQYKNLSYTEYENLSEEDKIAFHNSMLKEMLSLWLLNKNKAIAHPILKEFISDAELDKKTEYSAIIKAIQFSLEKKKYIPIGGKAILEFLSELASFASFEKQLDYISKNWLKYLNPEFQRKLHSLMAFIKEENDAIWTMFHSGEAYSPILTYNETKEQFTEDKNWMPNVVMIAKSTYVWLDQLSKKYKRKIRTLDEIPDEELDLLAQQGINALWLIGIWERSIASRKIKHIMGNPDAIASAYSIKDYIIAHELGGEEALHNLKDRAGKRHIRLASDMVPNHYAIDSNLVYEHPDYFIWRRDTPYPSYTFHGENLSDNPNIGIYIEDHYYNRSDAAVVFKRVDFRYGDTRYIYHGNDGTSIPWNDTAQLDFLKKNVREHVIQTILQIARNFPIIRFDAAMTLARKQVQRLWYPEFGSGGSIPSRFEFAMSNEEFMKHFPIEFWREVVDRIAEENPDTLLLAEAFWMLEGYFVRTLGMHRVYNSAFMNMLKNELNDQYRQSIKNTLEFDPEILKRFVNFMNNPDEETALTQFGDGDKYFGVLVMMCTMPGLPMLGHGQIEGFREKYGMEFKRAYWNENENDGLIARHNIEIFPLLRRRYQFSEVRYFLLYDFCLDNGEVNENVFVYSNKFNNDHSLIVFNNKYEHTKGRIKNSVKFLDKWNSERRIKQSSIHETLQLTNSSFNFVIFRDFRTNKQYIRKSQDIIRNGLYFELAGYQYHILLDFYEVEDNDRIYQKICEQSKGRGFEDINPLVLEQKYAESLTLLEKTVFCPENFELVFSSQNWLTKEFKNSLKSLFSVIFKQVNNKEIAPEDLTIFIGNYINDLSKISQTSPEDSFLLKEIPTHFIERLQADWPYLRSIFYCVASLRHVASCIYEYGENNERDIHAIIHELHLTKRIIKFVRKSSKTKKEDDTIIQIIKILIQFYYWIDQTYPTNLSHYLKEILNNITVKTFLKVNKFNESTWFDKEKFEELMEFFLVDIIIQTKNTNLKLNQVETMDTKNLGITLISSVIENYEEQTQFNFAKLLNLIA